jgi:hypothetical protein
MGSVSQVAPQKGPEQNHTDVLTSKDTHPVLEETCQPQFKQIEDRTVSPSECPYPQLRCRYP